LQFGLIEIHVNVGSIFGAVFEPSRSVKGPGRELSSRVNPGQDEKADRSFVLKHGLPGVSGMERNIL
jgi:hypothetical protein